MSISDVLHNDSEVALGDLEPSVSVQQNNELATLGMCKEYQAKCLVF